MRARPATSLATRWMRPTSRSPGLPASTRIDSPAGVTMRVAAPPSTSIQYTSRRLSATPARASRAGIVANTRKMRLTARRTRFRSFLDPPPYPSPRRGRGTLLLVWLRVFALSSTHDAGHGRCPGPEGRILRPSPPPPEGAGPAPRPGGGGAGGPPHRGGRGEPLPLRRQRLSLSRLPARVRAAGRLAGRLPARALGHPEPRPFLRPRDRPGTTPPAPFVPLRDDAPLRRPARRPWPGGRPARDRGGGGAAPDPVPQVGGRLRVGQGTRPRRGGPARGRRRLRGREV